MSTAETTQNTPAEAPAEKGIKIFTYPKVVFLYPTLLMALICGIGMSLSGDTLNDPTKVAKDQVTTAQTKTVAKGDSVKKETEKTDTLATADAKTSAKARVIKRFTSFQNLLGFAFLVVFAFNVVVIAMDFPRFTLLAGILLAIAILFILLWVGVLAGRRARQDRRVPRDGLRCRQRAVLFSVRHHPVHDAT